MHSNVIQIDHKLAYEQALHLREIVHTRVDTRGDATAAPRGFAARSRVLVRLASLAQIGELARRLTTNVIQPANAIQTVHTQKNSVLNIRRTKTSAAELFRKTQYPYCN